MRLPRFTTIRLMVLVAVVGLVLATGIGVNRLWQRRPAYVRLALKHNWREQELRYAVSEGREFRSSVAATPARIAEMRRLAEHEATLAHKYLHAARYPWLPVSPDPPEPK
ncbi:hypothetical protein V5E97_13110 [Singulisphaera sp. Ch08]|uniref:Uncharacterized protein n=1 Tax=Singulisphaera sp. Ch08 TaxID=3120278 RepID=A0AAU7CN05_9BACT